MPFALAGNHLEINLSTGGIDKTEIDPVLQNFYLGGRGIGSLMILQALVDIKKRGLTLIPLCPFVAGYLKKHPHWKDLVLKGINIA